MLRLTVAQALRMERMGEALWPTEKLSPGEIGPAYVAGISAVVGGSAQYG